MTCRSKVPAECIVVQHSIYLCNWQWHVNQKYPQNALLHFCYNICYPNSPQCYVIYSLPIGSFVLPVAVNDMGKSRANIVWDTTGWKPSFKTASLADPLLDSLSMRLIIQGTKKENTDFPALCTIDSWCRISCGLDCLPGDCAEQFGELCQEGVATETASECRHELRMLRWFRT